jgi:predicted AlkP superfamily phosphohydrolase/phosphomutase
VIGLLIVPLLLAPGRPASAAGRLVYLALDGIGADAVETLIARGTLPHLAELKSRGGYARLLPTPPASEEALWASFAIGAGPGHHGLFDFTVPDLATRRPLIADSAIEPPSFRFRLWRKTPPQALRRRQGTAFWTLLDERGVPVELLFLPVTFPPDTLSLGRMISGLGTPDLRLTRSTFTVLTTGELESERIAVPGGQIVRLRSEGEDLIGEIEGPPDPRSNTPARLKQEVAIRVEASGFAAHIEIGGIRRTLRQREWGDLLPATFSFSPFTKATGWVRPYLINTSPLAVYFSPVNLDPENPYVPFSFPPGFAGELWGLVGPFETIGWVEDTFALNAGVLKEKPFLECVHRALLNRISLIEREIGRADWRFFAAALLSFDRVAHTFGHLAADGAAGAAATGSALETIARRLDELIGTVGEGLEPDDRLVVFSTHGMASFERGFNLNTWLAEEGYLATAGQAGTRAYGLGNGAIYLNRVGREAEGSVAPEAAGALLDEISDKLEALVDDETGANPIRRVLRGDAIFDGPLASAAPDLVLIYRDGYSTSWASLLGGQPPGLFSPNKTRWTGEHASADPEQVAGFVLADRPLRHSDPSLNDLAATALAHLGIDPPEPMTGRPLIDP